jgi:hypothetical protein
VAGHECILPTEGIEAIKVAWMPQLHIVGSSVVNTAALLVAPGTRPNDRRWPGSQLVDDFGQEPAIFGVSRQHILVLQFGGRQDMDALSKYVSVRRLFIFLERSIYEGAQSLLFEPNDDRCGHASSTQIASSCAAGGGSPRCFGPNKRRS